MLLKTIHQFKTYSSVDAAPKRNHDDDAAGQEPEQDPETSPSKKKKTDSNPGPGSSKGTKNLSVSIGSAEQSKHIRSLIAPDNEMTTPHTGDFLNGLPTGQLFASQAVGIYGKAAQE